MKLGKFCIKHFFHPSKAKIAPKYTPPYTRSKTMEELKEKIDKMEKDIKSIAANQEGLKEKMQNNNTLLKNDLVLVERRLGDKLDILSEKQKNMDDKMSTIMQNINTLTQNMSTMTQNQNTMIGMLQKLRFGTNHISSSNMLDQYVNKNERNQVY